MLQLAIVFLLLALVAGIFGYSGLVTDFTGVAQFLFATFIALFLITAVAGALRGRPPGMMLL